MSKKQQTQKGPQNTSQTIKTPLSDSAINPLLTINQNHLSSTHEHMLMYEQKNIEIQFLTQSTQIPKKTIQNHMKQPLIPTNLKGEQIFLKYGSMIQNQPEFLKDLIFHNYLSYLPQKFQNQFSQTMLIGTGFEFVWWSSLGVALIQMYRHRHADFTFREKGAKFLGYAFLFVASSLGFYQNIYTPNLKKCYFKNIKFIDSLMDRHIKILQSCGVKFQQNVPIQPDQTIKAPTEPIKQIETSQISQKTNLDSQQVKPLSIQKQNNSSSVQNTKK